VQPKGTCRFRNAQTESRIVQTSTTHTSLQQKIHLQSFSSSESIVCNEYSDSDWDDDHDEDEQEEQQLSLKKTYAVDSYTASVVRDGRGVSIRFPVSDGKDESSTFDAEWLWTNCPSGVLPDSGQRTRSPGEYPQWKVQSANIVSATDAAACITYGPARPSGNSTRVLPVPPPPPGSCHPILGNNLFRGTTESKRLQTEQPLLQVIWDTATSKRQADEETSVVSYFDMEWLRQWRYDETSLKRRRERTEVTAANAFPATGHGTESGLVEVKYSDIASADGGIREHKGLFALFQALFDDGAALVTGASSADFGQSTSTPVALVGKALAGSLSHGSLYGDIFHVKSIPSAHNIAYTSLPCRPHQDLAYYQSPPGIQMLLCVGTSPTLVGGESVLVDCMAAAEHLRRTHPDYFRTLVTCPATFVKQRDGACMTYLRPHIVLKEGPDMNDMDREIVAVNWSPPFEGPLCIPAEQVREYYKAYTAFDYMLDNALPIPDADESNHFLSRNEMQEFASYAHENTWEFRLKPGEMLVFNNRRMVHGRRGFALDNNETCTDEGDELQKNDESENGHDKENEKPIRHLVGAYADIDDTLCRYRVLLQEQMKPTACIPNVGNGSSLIP